LPEDQQRQQQHTLCTAVALAGHPAASVSFQRHQPNQPPCKNADSALSLVLPACQFSGSIAICADCAAINSMFADYDELLAIHYRHE
jgi:hypothetical protein